MDEQEEFDPKVEELWRRYLTTGEFEKERRQRALFRLLPGTPRCKNCYAPFSGVGGTIARLGYGKQPSNLNPSICNVCEQFARKHQGGAEIELSLLFADVRGSTALGEKMSPMAYSRLINRLYRTATEIMVWSDALIDKIMGDQVAAMYVPGFAGPTHPRRAIESAIKIMIATGHARPEQAWIPVGAGVHTGKAFVGSVGSDEGTADITVLGDTANTTARLSSLAREGEILISDVAYSAAGRYLGELETRRVDLKGKSQSTLIHVLPAERLRGLQAQ
jgi:adenylate cyclase